MSLVCKALDAVTPYGPAREAPAADEQFAAGCILLQAVALVGGRSCCRLRVTGYGLRVTGYGLRVTGYGLRVTGYGLRVTGYGL
jgi:hypothetical protein